MRTAAHNVGSWHVMENAWQLLCCVFPYCQELDISIKANQLHKCAECYQYFDEIFSTGYSIQAVTKTKQKFKRNNVINNNTDRN